MQNRRHNHHSTFSKFSIKVEKEILGKQSVFLGRYIIVLKNEKGN